MVKEQQWCHSGHQHCSFWQQGTKYTYTISLQRKLDLNKNGQERELKIIKRIAFSSVKPLGLEHATFACQYCQPQTAQVALMLPEKDWSCNMNWVAVFGVSPYSDHLRGPLSALQLKNTSLLTQKRFYTWRPHSPDAKQFWECPCK